jgi:protein involved in polysaccharide export with SLBB domain
MTLRFSKLLGLCFLCLAGMAAHAQTPAELRSSFSAPMDTGSVAETVRITSPTETAPDINRPNPRSAVAATTKPASAPAKPLPPNEFQKFALEATGRLLPIYGADFFLTARGYMPLQGTPVSGDYPLGPGDEVTIRGWGSVEVDYRAVIDRNGLINIPKVGSVMLAGVSASRAEEVVRTAFSKVFRGFSLNVSLGQLRGITVYVVGQARRPGSYTVSSLSSIVTALFESGGPSANGSLRRIQVKRADKLVAELDLYAFLAHGNKSEDIRLLDGDVIVIPPAHGFVALTGKVETPAVYELKGPNETIQSLLEIAGGLPVFADPRRALIERIDPTRQQPRYVDEFALDSAGLSKELKNGDLISVLSITSEFANTVTLRGSVSQAMRVPYRPGMKVRDLIPSKDFLLTRAVVRRQNSGLIDQQRREDARERKLYPLEDSLLQKTREQQYGDRAERKLYQDERGEPGERGDDSPQQKSSDPNQLIAEPDSKSLLKSIGNRYDEINWDYAVVERINRANLTESLLPFNLGGAMADPNGPDNIALQAGDTVTVFSANDLQIPIAKRKVFVRLEGEVRKPGVYQIASGETLINLVEKAGGLTPDAFLFGSEFERESVRKLQQQNLESFIRRIEQQGLSESSRMLANVASDNQQKAIDTRLAFETESRKRLMQRLRELKSSGRIALGLSYNENNLGNIPALGLENGDRLFIPNRPSTVQVIGSVGVEAALLWQPGRSVSDYIALAGVNDDANKDNLFVLRADGTASSNSGRWISSVAGLPALPGDVIVVPEKSDKETYWTTFMRNAKDITQVFANFGLGAAALKTLK